MSLPHESYAISLLLLCGRPGTPRPKRRPPDCAHRPSFFSFRTTGCRFLSFKTRRTVTLMATLSSIMKTDGEVRARVAAWMRCRPDEVFSGSPS